MKKPYVIAINSVSGGGKTALAELLAQSLPKSFLLCFDDFDETNLYPEDYYKWSKRGANLLEFDCLEMRKAAEQALKQSGLEYLILDYPFGRDHPRLADLIDLSVFIDTPLDVAMARRILRDYRSSSNVGSEQTLQELKDNLIHYLQKARYPYLDTYRLKQNCDLVIDGWTSLEHIRDTVLLQIRRSAAS